MRRKRSVARAALALTIVSVVGAPFLLPYAAAQLPGNCGSEHGYWTSIDVPRFRKGGSSIVAHGVDPLNPNLVFVANDQVVQQTGDGGCEWATTFEGSASLPGNLATYSIKHLVSPRPNAAVVVMVEGGGPKVAFTADAGATWQIGGAGLPPAGDPEFIAFSPTQAAVLLGIDIGGGGLDLLFSSTDLGATWILRSDLSKTIPQAGITGAELDPVNPDSVWAYGPGGLYRSVDGGQSFEAVDEFVGDSVTAVDVVGDGGPSRVLAFRAARPAVGISRSDGTTWTNLPDAPKGVDSAAGATTEYVMTSAGGRAYLSDFQNARFIDAGVPTSGVEGFVTTVTEPYAFVGHTPSTIEVFQQPGSYVPTPYDLDVSLQDRTSDVVRRSAFGPDGKKIRLAPGESKVVNYDLELPPRQVPLDVYFVVDTSSSMTRPLAGLATSLAAIAQELENRGLDVWFGLAEYRSYPDRFIPRPSCEGYQGPPGQCEGNFLYRRLADVGPDVEALEAAIESLYPYAGGQIDAQLPALYTTATGSGQDIHPVGVKNENGTDVPPGLEASFRDKSVRVVIHSSDEALPRRDSRDSDNSPQNAERAPWPENMPTVEEVGSAFRAKDIHLLNIALGNAEYLLSDMRALSRAAGSVVVRDPLDCDGNGTPDVAVNEPLVCHLSSTESGKARHVVPAVVNLLQAVQPTEDVSLKIVSGRQAVRGFTPDVHEGVVLQTVADLSFQVTYRCPLDAGGERFAVEIAPLVGDRVRNFKRVDATVICDESPQAPLIPPVVAPLVAIPLVPAAPPPPAPVTNAQPATQSQAQMQGAAAQQEQEEPQLAVATADDGMQEEELYAMSAYEDRRGPAPEGVLGMGVVAVSLMYGLGYSLRRRTQQQHQRR